MALAEEARAVVRQFDYSDENVNKGVKEFLRQLDEGLHKDGTSLSQIPTYVTAVPNGTEKGLYLAVDLGGTNFRVCSINLNGDSTFKLTYSKVAIPKELMVAKTSEELFSFLAKQIEDFLKTHHFHHYETHVRRRNTVSSPTGYKDEHVFRLGFTFSFPVKQVGINKGTLIRWTKGFDIPDTVGKDVCALLQTEIDKLHLPVKVAALVNDTVGTLMARSYAAPGKTGAVLGAIFGTGTNGAYVEKLSNIKKPLEGEFDDTTGDMVINTEWGSFDNQLNVLPTTPWDVQLDKESPNPGFQMFEKRVSGMFLGEIVRLAILDMMQNDKISFFKDENSSFNDWRSTTNIGKHSGLFRQWGLDSSILSVAAADANPELGTLRQQLEGQGQGQSQQPGRQQSQQQQQQQQPQSGTGNQGSAQPGNRSPQTARSRYGTYRTQMQNEARLNAIRNLGGVNLSDQSSNGTSSSQQQQGEGLQQRRSYSPPRDYPVSFRSRSPNRDNRANEQAPFMSGWNQPQHTDRRDQESQGDRQGGSSSNEGGGPLSWLRGAFSRQPGSGSGSGDRRSQ